MGKSSSEQRFINPPPLPLSCEISGALHLAQPGLTAGWLAGRLAGRQAGWLAGWQAGWLAGRLAGRQAGRLADEIQVDFEIFKIGCRLKYSSFRFV